jgi:PPOX class probable F420-dependent enzyme
MTEATSAPSGPYMGHGVKQRDLIKMTPDEVEEFIHGKRTATMCTHYRDGSIHAVGMWYGFINGHVAMESKAKAQKVLNLRRDPRITVLIEEGIAYEELRGVSIVGTAEIIEDRERLWEVGVSVFSRYNAPYTEEMKPFVEALIHKRVAIEVIPKKIVTWDHRKLSLPPTQAPS